MGLKFEDEEIDGFKLVVSRTQIEIDKPLTIDEHVEVVLTGVINEITFHVDGKTGLLHRIQHIKVNEIEVK